jgi:hypothetical protein
MMTSLNIQTIKNVLYRDNDAVDGMKLDWKLRHLNTLYYNHPITSICKTFDSEYFLITTLNRADFWSTLDLERNVCAAPVFSVTTKANISCATMIDDSYQFVIGTHPYQKKQREDSRVDIYSPQET